MFRPKFPKLVAICPIIAGTFLFVIASLYLVDLGSLTLGKFTELVISPFSKKFAMTGWRVGASIGPEKIINIIAKLNINAESCTTHFIQEAMVEALTGDMSGAKEILNRLKKRRNVAVSGLNAIDGIDISMPRSTFYLFPNVTTIMKRKGFESIDELQVGALENANVSFCTRNHFGRPQEDEIDYFIRLA